ncbi:MAG: hypothetical protein JWN07_1782 [Hyphomicrobiales bacterium]|nr:hypothetical protein [Hyphomicrobiales bacterium]
MSKLDCLALRRLRPALAALLGAGLTLAACTTMAASQTPAPAVIVPPVAAPKRVLFLGNSLVYYSGGLQTHVHRMAGAATPPIDLKDGFKSVHITGAGLDQYPIDFLVAPGHLGQKEPFELVVLAGNSLDARADASRALYRQKVIEFDAAIRKQGGRTALLWLPAPVKPHALAGSDLGARTEDMMLSVGNETNALIIPVALAYREAYRRKPDVKLQVYDGNHPTLAGQYLAASVVFATLYDRSPVGNPYDYFGALDGDTRLFLQQVAADTVRDFYRHDRAGKTN